VTTKRGSNVGSIVTRVATGHRPPPSAKVPTQRTKSFPAEDAAANTIYIANAKPPNRSSKPFGTMAPGLSLNAGPPKHLDHSNVQRRLTPDVYSGGVNLLIAWAGRLSRVGRPTCS
jgi:hypothetical protein